MDKRVTYSGGLSLLWLAQTFLEMISHSVKKVTKPVAVVFVPCMRTGVNAKTCFMKLPHRKYTGFDGDGLCIKKMVSSLVDTLERQILTEDSDKGKVEKVRKAARLYLQNFIGRWSLSTRTAFETPIGRPFVRSLPPHVMKFISPYFCEMNLRENVRHILGISFSDKFLARSFNFGGRSLLS